MKKKRLIFQLYPSYLIVILLSLFTVSWYSLTYMHRFFLDRVQESLNTQAILLLKRAKELISSMDYEALDRFCKESGEDTITRITIILTNGKVIGDSKKKPAVMDNHRDRPEIRMAFSGKTGVAIRYSHTLKQNMMYVAIPIRVKNSIPGVIRTAIAVTAIDRQIKSVRSRIVQAGFFVALLASVMCWYISRRISMPIENMKKGAKLFAKGELDHRLTPPGTIEFADLAGTMNHMAKELKNKMEEICSQQSRMEAVLSSMTEGVIATGPDGKIIRINKAALYMFNTTKNKADNKDIGELIRNNKFEKIFAKTLLDGKVGKTDIELHKNGKIILNMICSPLFDANNTRIGGLVVINDVTKMRQLENVRHDFASNVSHEIRTPLTSIKGFVETIISGGLDNKDEIVRFLRIIEKNVDRLTFVIDDLIRLSKIEKNSALKQIKLELSSISHVIDNAVSICAKQIEDKKIKMKIFYKQGLKAKINAGLLEQACINLLDNAIKYSPPKSVVIIEGVKAGKEIELRFKDRGCGISSKHLPRIFERFYRVDKARSRKLGGTGLGLAIVKHISKAHNGRVSVASIPGKGSTFTIHLPYTEY